MTTLGKTRRILLVFFYLVIAVRCRTVDVDCPDYCECDTFQKLKRAICQDRKLFSIELNIPKQAQILDVSQNHIRELGDKVFLDLGLTNLKLLNLSHNVIRQIHFNAFDGMAKLKTLDLSYNAVEYFTKSWFQSWLSLEELYLRGNNLRSINEQPQIAINSLKVLDLASCGITSLKADIFQLVPKLEVLDISQNYIQMIQLELLQNVPKLIEFRTEGNSFNCNLKFVSDIRNYTKIHSIFYTNDCTKTTPNIIHKFEKIVMGSDDVIESTTALINRKNTWILNESEEETNESKNVNKCENQTIEVTSEDDDESLLMTIIKLSPWIVSTIIFFYGVLFGVVISCCIRLCWTPRRNGKSHENVQRTPTNHQGKHRIRRSNSTLYKSLQKARLSKFHHELEDDDSGDDTLVMHEFDLANSTPVFPRKVMT